MSLSENKGLWLSITLLAAVGVVIVWIVARSQPFQLVVLFDDIGGLQPGDPVVWKSFKIGRVEKIQPLVDNKIGVTVRIKEEYTSSLTHGTEFVLKQARFLGLIGDNAIEVVTPPAAGSPFVSGEKVPGRNPPIPSALETGVARTLQYLQQLKESSNRMLQEFQDSPFRRDLEEAMLELQDIAQKGSLRAREGLEQFRKDHKRELDAAVRKLERLRDEMRRSGDERGAHRVEEEIDKVQLPAEAPVPQSPAPHQ